MQSDTDIEEEEVSDEGSEVDDEEDLGERCKLTWHLWLTLCRHFILSLWLCLLYAFEGTVRRLRTLRLITIITIFLATLVMGEAGMESPSDDDEETSASWWTAEGRDYTSSYIPSYMLKTLFKIT